MQTPEYLEVVRERDELRAKNQQLWKIVQKQRSVIMQMKGENVELPGDNVPSKDNHSHLNSGIITENSTIQDSSSLSRSGLVKDSSLPRMDSSVDIQTSKYPIPIQNSVQSLLAPEPKSNTVLTSTKDLQITVIKSRKTDFQPGIVVYVFIFKLQISNDSIDYIEKGPPEFVALEKLLSLTVPNFTETIGTLPRDEDFMPPNSSRKIGEFLQNWLMRIIASFPDLTAMIEFFSTHRVPPPAVKVTDINQESFKKSGCLSKKGNYFGGWKTRFYSLDTATGIVHYSDVTNQEETLGSFTLHFAYCVPYASAAQTSKKDADVEKPGFVVTEYKKGAFPMKLENCNADGLPAGKVDFRHVFFTETVQERDVWVRCLAGMITRLRPDDSVAKQLFSHTVPPELDQLSRKSSAVSMAENPMPPNDGSLEWKKLQPKVSMGDKLGTSSHHSNSSKQPKQAKKGATVKPTPKVIPAVKAQKAESSPNLPPVENINPIEPIKRPIKHTSTVKSSTDRSTRPQARYVDDHSRCLQQPLPPLLVEDLPVGKSNDASKRKTNMFKDWMKRSNHEPMKPQRPLFGVTIQDAVVSTRIKPGIDIPAIVYRCIEYLDAKKGIRF